MIKFLFKRLTYGFLVLIGVAIVVFFIFNVLPGDPVSMIAGQNADAKTREMLTKELGLDKPRPIQLLHYLNDISPLSIHKNQPEIQEKYNYFSVVPLGANTIVLKKPYLRHSYASNQLVTEIISESIVPTFWLGLSAMIFASFFGIGFGILSALNRGSWIDKFLVTFSVMGVSTPSFIAGILFALLFGYYWGDYTGLNSFGSLWENNGIDGRQLVLKNLILPAFTLGIRPLAIIVQLTRSSMLEVLSQDYIRTARAKGVSRVMVILKHALKNALNPVLTSISGFFASLLAGSIIIERIFSWNGIGDVSLIAVEQKDLPVVMGCTLLVASLFILVNILVDISYRFLDPRVKLE